MTQTTRNDGAAIEAVREIVESASADKVFGNLVHQDGLIVLPVAKVSGGGGGGTGTGPATDGGDAGGTGGGVGLTAKPLGVFVIKDGKVGWRPAVDLNKIIMGAQIVAVVALLTVRALAKARAKATACGG